MMDMIVGIDPGLSGAVAAIHLPPEVGRLDCAVAVWDIPTKAKKAGRQRMVVRNMVDADELVKVFEQIEGKVGRHETTTVVMEQVTSGSGQGVSSVFSLGDTFGTLRGVCAALGMNLVLVRPQLWKAYWELSEDKNASLALARRKFGDIDELARKKDHNRAEALLIALWYADSIGSLTKNPTLDYVGDMYFGRR